MVQTLSRRAFLALAVAVAASSLPATAQSGPSVVGVVIMHGKGGSPAKHVADLASALEARGCLVANLEMPWSARRDYDVSVATAEREVESALDQLRARGARTLFVAGHSQGGLFALYYGGRHPVDGVIAMAPGGNVGNPIFREKLGDSVDQARKLVADGKGDERTRFLDYEGAKGTYPVIATPANYLGWFDPDGAMNQTSAMRNMNPAVPVLYVAPRGDYPALARVRQSMFDALPRHPLTALYEPDSNHLGAPSASLDEILRWTRAVADRAGTAP
ncbi:MAG TPA: hypothetical protein VIO81_00185 [Methyloversatilis sp.]